MIRSLRAGSSSLKAPIAQTRARHSTATELQQTNARRVSRAKDKAWAYQTGQDRLRAEAELEDAEALKKAEVAAALEAQEEAEAAAARKAERPEVANDESAQWRYGPLGFTRGGWAGLVDERIEAARAAGAFKNNKLRGKPLVREVEEMNPFMSREEFLMNRIMRRQGVSPPWVELNGELDKEVTSFRGRLFDNWVRRAVRIIMSRPELRRDCDPLPARVLHEASAKAGEISTAAKDPKRAHLVAHQCADTVQLQHLQAFVNSGEALPGHGMLLETCKSYRDGEWVQRELKFHSIELMDINVKVRRYNGLAPFNARKIMLDRENELDRTFAKAAGRIAAEVSEELRAEREGRSAAQETVHKKPHAARRMLPSLDIWAREIPDVQPVESDFGSLQPMRGVRDRSGGGGGHDGFGGDQDGQHNGPGGVGLMLLLRRTTDWVRSRVGV